MNRVKSKGIKKNDLENQDFLNKSELYVYLTGIGDTKIDRLIQAGVFTPVLGVFSRIEIDNILQNFSSYKSLFDIGIQGPGLTIEEYI